MKQLIYASLIGTAVMLNSFRLHNSSTLYPKIESYFTTLDLTKTAAVNSDILSDLKGNIEFSQIDTRHTYLISSENSDAAAFAHIILYSWLKEKKFKKVDLITCAPSQKISESSLQTLIDIGYKIEYTNGVYNIQFSEKEKPLKLDIYSCSDKKAEEPKFMKLKLIPAGSGDEDPKSTLYYSSNGSKEMFQSLATDLYFVIKGLKK